MDVATAIADIDSVMKQPSGITTGGGAAVAAAIARYYACVCRYCLLGTPYRTEAERYMAMGFSGAVRVAGIASKDQALYGVLAALKEDIAAGKLAVFEELVHANVYGDLLAQGDGLHRDGYHRAAVVVVGAALEEHVRLLAVKNAVPIAHPDGTPKKATALNSELEKTGVYAETQRATVESWQKLRNDAAHGNPGFELADKALVPNIEPMIVGVRGFVIAWMRLPSQQS